MKKELLMLRSTSWRDKLFQEVCKIVADDVIISMGTSGKININRAVFDRTCDVILKELESPEPSGMERD